MTSSLKSLRNHSLIFLKLHYQKTLPLIFNFCVFRPHFVMWVFTIKRKLTALNGYAIGLICPDCQNSRLFCIKVQQYYTWIDPVYISHTRLKSLMTARYPWVKKVLTVCFSWHAKGAVTLKPSFRNKYSIQASNWFELA